MDVSIVHNLYATNVFRQSNEIKNFQTLFHMCCAKVLCIEHKSYIIVRLVINLHIQVITDVSGIIACAGMKKKARGQR